MARVMACLLLLACGSSETEDRVPFVEDTAPPAGTAELKQACYEACDARYKGAEGCPPETGEELRDGCWDECNAKAARLVEACLADAEAYFSCIEDLDWLCAQGEDEPRVLDEEACAAETAKYEACPI